MSLPKYNTRLQTKLFQNTSVIIHNPSYIQHTIDHITQYVPNIKHYLYRFDYQPVAIFFNQNNILTIKAPLLFIYQFLNLDIAPTTISYFFYRQPSTRFYTTLFSKYKSHIYPLQDNCIICFHTMHNTPSFTTTCNHTFHYQCISKWILTYSKKYCPTCNTHLLPQ